MKYLFTLAFAVMLAASAGALEASLKMQGEQPGSIASFRALAQSTLHSVTESLNGRRASA